MLSDHMYSSHKLTQFSQVNNVLDLHAYNIDDFLTKDTVFLPFPLLELFFTKVMFLILENPER
jgi:hypothetical protein